MKKKWIWNHKTEKKNVYVDFVKEITIAEVDKEAAIQIAADSEYELFINGTFVDCGTFKDYPELKRIDTINISDYLIVGKNRICITVFHYGKSTFQYALGKAGMCFEIVNGRELFASDENVLSAPSVCYRQGDIFDTTEALGYGFIYNASMDDDWRNPISEIPERFEKSAVVDGVSYQNRPVKKCILEPVDHTTLKSQGFFIRKEDNPNISVCMSTDYLSYRAADEIFDQNWNVKTNENFFALFDLAKERCGYLILSVCADEGTVLDISYGEHVDDLRVRASVGGRCFANRYICKAGQQTFTYHFRRIGGRYIEVHVTGNLQKIDCIGIVGCKYPFEQEQRYRFNDSLCNKIYEISADTLKHCMHEHYEDCPWREQALYASDSRNQMLCTYFLHHDYEFARASLDLLGCSMKEKPYIRMVAPSDSELIIPSFSFIWILAVKEYTYYSKDVTLAEKYQDMIQFMIAHWIAGMCDGIAVHPSGLECWNFYEWSSGNDGISGNTFVTDVFDYQNGRLDGLYQMFLYMAIKSAEDILTEEKGRYTDILEKMKNSINAAFWDEDKQLYATYVDNNAKNHYCELMQIMAIYNDIAGEKTEHLCNVLVSENDLVEVTLSYRIYLYDALLRFGTRYAEWVYENIVSVWGDMLLKGATTFWETKDGADDFDKGGSLCHGWSAIPIYIFGRYCADNNIFAPHLFLR